MTMLTTRPARAQWRALLASGSLCLLVACGGGESSAPIEVAPSFLSQPLDVQTTVGNEARFTAEVQGSELKYQWQRSTDGGGTWLDVDQGTGASLVLKAVSLADHSSKFRVVISTKGGSITSSAASLSVTSALLPAAITVQPAPVQLSVGGNASLTVTATGSTLAYQWQSSADGQSWQDLAGATSAQLQVSAASLSQSGTLYRVVVGNSLGKVTSVAVALTVMAAPAIPSFATQPVALSVTAPASASFSAQALGSPAPSYQWQRSTDKGASWDDVAGAVNASFTIAATTAADSGTLYRVLARNASGSVASEAVLLSVTPAAQPVSISQQPQDLSLAAGQTASWTVLASGSPSPAYQWQLSTDGGASYANINGATQASYSLVVGAADNGRQYRVQISNSQGTVSSRAARLTVVAPQSALSGRAWTKGQLLETGDGLMPGVMAAGIDDQGRVISVFAKQDGARIALQAVRSVPGAAGAPASVSSPVILDKDWPFDWKTGVNLSVSPAGNALAGWPVVAPCTANSYSSSGKCNYWVVARFLQSSGVWEAPVVVADMPMPMFEASINDAGDIAGLANTWTRDAKGELDASTLGVIWRAAGQASFTRRAFAVADVTDIFIPRALTLANTGGFLVSGIGKQGLVQSYDVVAYRGHVRDGLGAREVIDLRGGNVPDVKAYGNALGQFALLWSQDNGSRPSTYVASLDQAGGNWSLTDLGLAPFASASAYAAALSDSGDFHLYAWGRCSQMRRHGGVWGAETPLPVGSCAGAPVFKLARNGDFLALQTTQGSAGRWLSFDAARQESVHGYSTEGQGEGFLLGLPALPKGELLLAPNGIGAYLSLNAYDVLPGPGMPNGDSRGVISLWGVSFK
ncbi:hypothetical protein RQP53_16340 [Paucibacter sp. APW11]|uniref:Immunoglobulin domain-containing protein n=1 Tax=Roseateles aquae TaxID=3077235 RepID=A0ABU3PE04_9BURK|nr:hypothetical protein [Paucibacter sp. APW11]MDT9000846.1 hypothetical protein [Paucibacter sp. APW11]